MPEKKKIRKRINPRIRSVEVGIRSLRKIKIYPLSMRDQKEVTRIINKALTSFFNIERKEGENEELVFASFIIKVVEDNIERILGIVAPDEDIKKLMGDIDNAQLSDIIRIVYTDNYGDPAKNVTSLFQMTKIESVLKRQQSPSAENIVATDLNTSLEEVSKKAE